MATDWTPGQFYLSIVSWGLKAYVGLGPPQLYYREKNSFWNKSTYMAFNNGGLNIFSDFSDKTYNYNEFLSLGISSSVQFMRLDSDGHRQSYQWAPNGWKLLVDVFNSERYLDNCAYPMVCEEYGLCFNGECSCPDTTYFRQIDGRQLNFGCYLVTPLSCESTSNHHFLPLANVSYFNYKDLDAATFQKRGAMQAGLFEKLLM